MQPLYTFKQNIYSRRMFMDYVSHCCQLRIIRSVQFYTPQQ